MLYVRGNPADYDGWAQQGCRGWSWDDVLPFFKRSERYVNGGDQAYRGTGGPLEVEDYRTILPMTPRFVAAPPQAGFRYRAHLNGAAPDSAGSSPLTRVDQSPGPPPPT